MQADRSGIVVAREQHVDAKELGRPREREEAERWSCERSAEDAAGGIGKRAVEIRVERAGPVREGGTEVSVLGVERGARLGQAELDGGVNVLLGLLLHAVIRDVRCAVGEVRRVVRCARN